ncbi:MAG: hydroxysqualene dehydroxylase HpnE [Ignavibacteria bacterium]|jgi:squalene-associated FAD-dependent desaturase
MQEPVKVCIVGAGMAGLSSAVFLKEYGINVILTEASPRPGGRVCSYFDNQLGDYLDNGQHILASWYFSTLELLKITGTIGKLKFQEQMEVHLADIQGKQFLFKCPKLPPPLHLLSGIWKYKALKLNDKLGIIRLMNFLILKKYEDYELKAIDLTELFKITNQPQNLIKMFWEPFVLAVFNSKPKDVCAWYFSNIVRHGFFKKDGANLILPLDSLNSIFVDGCVKYLEERNTSVMLQTRIDCFNFNNNRVESATLSNGNEIKADYYISAVPFYEFKNIVGDDIYSKHYNGINNLTASPIINIHHKINNHAKEVLNCDFVGMLGTVMQWVFKVKEGRICMIISSANEEIDKDKEVLIEMSKQELRQCLPSFKDVEFVYSKVFKEKRATFLPDIKSIGSRPSSKTTFNNFFIAGDWTDTGLPSTIESAVLSGKNCAYEIIKSIHSK